VSDQDAPGLELSVVVPTYRRAASIERLLASLTRQLEPPTFEVIVAIDGSEDGTRETVDSFAGRLPVQALWQSHRGRAAACNAGARRARGRILVLLDDDMEPAPEFLREHSRAHLGDARLALVGPAPIRDDASSRPIVRYRAAGFARKLERLRQSDSEPGVGDLYTGNFSLPRELFLEVGGFDEGFVCYGNEDKELLVRLRRAGARLGFAPRALATQHYEKEYADLARDTTGEGQNAVLFAERHPALLDDLYLMEFERFPLRRRAALAVACGLARARVPGERRRVHPPRGAERVASITLVLRLRFRSSLLAGRQDGIARPSGRKPAVLVAVGSFPSRTRDRDHGSARVRVVNCGQDLTQSLAIDRFEAAGQHGHVEVLRDMGPSPVAQPAPQVRIPE